MLLTLLGPIHARVEPTAFWTLRTLSHINALPAFSYCLLLAAWEHSVTGYICRADFGQDASTLASRVFYSIHLTRGISSLPSQLKVATFFPHRSPLSSLLFYQGVNRLAISLYVDIQTGKSPFLISISHLLEIFFGLHTHTRIRHSSQKQWLFLIMVLTSIAWIRWKQLG